MFDVFLLINFVIMFFSLNNKSEGGRDVAFVSGMKCNNILFNHLSRPVNFHFQILVRHVPVWKSGYMKISYFVYICSP